MMAQISRDPWQTAWRVATSDHLIAVLLLITGIGLAIAAWLPQMPVGDPVAYARWFSEVQVRFKDATSTMQALGLFTVTRSAGFRALLAILAGCMLLRLIESGDRLRQHREIAQPAGKWHTLVDVHLPDLVDDLRRQRYRMMSDPPLLQVDRWPWADLLPILAHGGGLLLLIGLLITQVWGWRTEGLIVQSGERVTLSDTEKWVMLEEDDCRPMHSAGIVTSIEECGPGVRVSAVDGTGTTLALQQASEAEPVPELTLPLTQDRYFAIPEAQLIFRLTPQPSHAAAPHSPVLIQVYRSPPGRLMTETTMVGDAELSVDNVTLKLASVPYARLTATFNPGLWPTGAGLLLLGVGTLASTAWPTRRFWLREETERVEGNGDLPPALARAKDT